MTQGPGPQDPQNPYGQPGQPAPGQNPGGVPPQGVPPQQPQQPGGQTSPPPPPPPGGPGQYGGQAPPPPPPPPGGPGQPPPGGPGQYGGQAPPPPPPPSGGGSDSQATDSIKRGWELFTKNVAPFLIGMLLWGIAFAIVYALMFGVILLPALGSGSSTSFSVFGGIGFIGMFLLVLVMIVLGMLAQAGFVNAALKAHDTGKAEIGDFFKFRNVGQVLIYGLVVGAANGLLAFTGIGSIVVGALTLFGMFLIVDRNMGFWDAILGSMKLFLNNFAQSAILFVLVMVVVAVGAAICLVGLLVAGPVAMLAIATYYRTLGQVPNDFKVG